MQLGLIGLGRMGANMVLRLVRAGEEVVVLDRKPTTVKEIADQGAVAVLVQRHAEAESRRHGALVVVEDVRALRGETQQVAVVPEDRCRFFAERPGKRLLGEDEVREV